jgi:hypothetical protein
MFDARRLITDAVCVAALAFLMIWGAEAIAAVPITLPPTLADCQKPVEPLKQTTVAGGLPGLNLADCGDKDKNAPGAQKSEAQKSGAQKSGAEQKP